MGHTIRGLVRVALSGLAALSLGTVLARGQAGPERSFGNQVGVDLERHVASAKLAILPLGAIEFHGPSGPPLTDSIIAEGLASEMAKELEASLLPALSYTHCPAHTAVFKGSISIRPEVVTSLLTDILRGLVDNGFQRIFVLNAHNGNVGPAQAAISQVARERPGVQILTVNWWETLPTPDVERLNLFQSGNGGHGHGGPLELSVAAAFAPDSVRAGMGPDLPALEGQARFPYYLEKSDAAGWPAYSGKLSEISAEKGKALADLAAKRMTDLVRAWLSDSGRPGSW